MTAAQAKALPYDPSRFDVTTLDEAIAVILTQEGGMGSKERWKVEAPHLIGLLEQHIPNLRRSTVLDYGCGVGRLALPLVGKHDCRVVGADISANMRALSCSCVDSSLFVTCHPNMLGMFGAGWADLALAVWTLQHCLDPADDLDRICQALKPGGLLFLVNNNHRAVPSTNWRWVDDGVSIEKLVLAKFVTLAGGKLPAEILPREPSDNTFWAIYQKR